MLEHIFRNINDIRIFDVMIDFVLDEEQEKKEFDELLNLPDCEMINFNDIMEMLDYKEYQRIETKDSLDHLIRCNIIGIKKEECEGTTGCKICKDTDKDKLPRMEDHESHHPEETSIDYDNNYFMKANDITKGLRFAVCDIVTSSLEKEIDEINAKNIEKNIKKLLKIEERIEK